MEMTKYISVPKEVARELALTFKCSRQTVWAALKYKTTGGNAERIRALALQKGGGVIDPGRQNYNNLNS